MCIRDRFKISKKKIKTFHDSCGTIREIFSCKDFSISHVIVERGTKEHKHNFMKEFYYIEKGRGNVFIDNKLVKVEKGDFVIIPTGKWHKIVPECTMHIIVFNLPKFNRADMIYKE